MSKPKGMAMVHSVCDNLKQIEEDYPPGIMGKSMDMPVEVDFRERCSPIKDQGHLNSASAHAVIGMVEFFQKRHFGYHIDSSALFLYKVTRLANDVRGDIGVPIRKTMETIVRVGVLEEKRWPHTELDFDKEPMAHLYTYATSFKATEYERLDAYASGFGLLDYIKSFLSRDTPVVFGFRAYNNCILQSETSRGMIPYPSYQDTSDRIHALMAVGYDDTLRIRNKESDIETVGAFIVRNSWGSRWGDEGYGYLPYQYVLKGLTRDWWVLLDQKWVDLKQFE